MGKKSNNRCPICGQLLDERGVCRRCGFDDCVNYEDYQTLGRIPENVYSIDVKQIEYRNKIVNDAVQEDRERAERERLERERVERERAEKARIEKEKAEREKANAIRQQAEKAAREAAEQAKKAAEAEQRKKSAQAASNKQSTSVNKKSGFNPMLIVIPLVLAVVVVVGAVISGGSNSGKSSASGNNSGSTAVNQTAQPATTTAQQETTASRQETAVTTNNEVDTSEQIEVGDIITFGHYEQDNDTRNDKEEIEWIVLEVSEDGKQALIISRKGLDAVPYNTEYEDTTWENCSLRTWLNGEFLNTAFTEDEIARIEDTYVVADPNPSYDTDPGNDVTDKVFLLSLSEVRSLDYFDPDNTLASECRSCFVTDYALAQLDEPQEDNSCYWWLRTPGDESGSVVNVLANGYVNEQGYYVTGDEGAVRPALWINL